MHKITLISLLFVAIPGACLAQDQTKGHAVRPDKIQWGPAPPMLPKGAQFAVLSGDPMKAGPFTIRLKAAAGYKIPAHQHPTAERVTVISGNFHFGMGDKLDDKKAEALQSGGFVDLPANMNHFALTSSETVVQIDSEGPFSIIYVNPADDPTKSQ